MRPAAPSRDLSTSSSSGVCKTSSLSLLDSATVCAELHAEQVKYAADTTDNGALTKNVCQTSK